MNIFLKKIKEIFFDRKNTVVNLKKSSYSQSGGM
jgi:hypothetical protein